MEILSLKELKEKNAADEVGEQDEQVIEQQEAAEDEYVEDTSETVEGEAETEPAEEGGEEKVELESWMQTEEPETSEDSSGFKPNAKYAAKRKNFKALKGEITEQKDEIETLKAELQQYKSGNPPVVEQKQELPPRPTREQFDFDDDAYDAAIDDWNDKKLEIKLANHSQKTEAQKQQERNNQKAFEQQQQSLNQHYERAGKLVADGKVTEQAYHSADSKVRRAIERVFQGRGDVITDALISTLNGLGEGSEKVIYALGVNESKLDEFTNILERDQTGMAASAYLGKLHAKATTPNNKRRSQAPKPGSKVEGESGNGGKAGTLQKQYAKSDDPQTRISLKRKARQQGVDTSNW